MHGEKTKEVPMHQSGLSIEKLAYLRQGRVVTNCIAQWGLNTDGPKILSVRHYDPASRQQPDR